MHASSISRKRRSLCSDGSFRRGFSSFRPITSPPPSLRLAHPLPKVSTRGIQVDGPSAVAKQIFAALTISGLNFSHAVENVVLSQAAPVAPRRTETLVELGPNLNVGENPSVTRRREIKEHCSYGKVTRCEQTPHSTRGLQSLAHTRTELVDATVYLGSTPSGKSKTKHFSLGSSPNTRAWNSDGPKAHPRQKFLSFGN